MADEETEVVSGPLSFLWELRYRHLVAGVAGGVTSTLITHPFDLIKLRLAGMRDIRVSDTGKCCPDILVQDGRSSRERPRYRGPLHAFRCILREEGVRQLYRVGH